MPLWLQGALESAQAAFISALVVAAPILAVWATAGFLNGRPMPWPASPARPGC